MNFTNLLEPLPPPLALHVDHSPEITISLVIKVCILQDLTLRRNKNNRQLS